MRESSLINLFLIEIKFSSVLPSNLITSIGVVFDALNRPQPSSKFILKPSIEIFSPSKVQFATNFLTISNFFSSETSIFNSGVEKSIGNSLLRFETDFLVLDLSSIILAPE